MSTDTAREALHRIAAEMEIPTEMHPHLIATTVIQNVQRSDASMKRLEAAFQTANKRLETLIGEPES